MAETACVATTSGKGIAVKAGEVAALVAGKPYIWGGKTLNGFDCSGFVSYVLKQLYPMLGALLDLNVAGFMKSGLVEEVGESDKRPGDLVVFPKTGGNPNHIGIVLDNESWIGSQSSGVGIVKFSHPWWGRRTKKFLRMKCISTASIDAGRGVFTAMGVA